MADLSGVWRYDSSEVIAAPAAGYLRTGPAPVTAMAVAAQNSGGTDARPQLLAISTGGRLSIQQVNNATLATNVAVLAAPFDHTTWVEYSVGVVASSATGPPNKNQDLLLLGWVAAAAHSTYATLDELKALLRIDAPTAQQTTAMQRALDEAAAEIDWELGYTAASPAPSPTPPLVVGVNLDRAVEHWRQSYSPFGVIGVGSESEPIVTARNSWYRHALKLAPLKDVWGVA